MKIPTATFAPNSENSRATPQLLDRFRALVDANTHRWKRVLLLEALGLAIAVPLAYLWFVLFLDNQLHFPLIGRFLAGIGVLIGMGGGATHLVRRWQSIQLTEDQVALAIERGTAGGVQNRLINAMQLARGGPRDHPELSEAVVQENCERLQQVHLEL